MNTKTFASFLVLASSWFALVQSAAATTLEVESDDFPPLTVMTNVVPGVTVTLPDPFVVISIDNYSLPSTGTNYFGIRGPGGFTGFFALHQPIRFHFDRLGADSVSIDVVNGSGSGLKLVGRLDAYDCAGNLVGSAVSRTLTVDGEFETLTVQTTGFKIAYALAAIDDTSEIVGGMDHFVANVDPSGACFCGDGAVSDGESCDDGNTVGGDCCSATCQVEDCSLTAAADSFLRISRDDSNEGANTILSLRRSGRHRPVVSFDVAGKNPAAVQSAHLVLTIRRNGHGWSGGRAVEAHALLDPFVEGNGMWLGSVPPVRGSGAGVTWSCAIDTDISNFMQDCSAGWNGGNFAAAPSDSQTVTDTTTGETSFDVTGDVKDGISAWLIKKADESRNGRVLYYSREGAENRGDPGLAPRLELDY